MKGQDGDVHQVHSVQNLAYIMNGDILIPRLEVEWTNIDLAIAELNTESRYTMTCSSPKNE